ncbi:putative ribonuclease H-like domain-containing protein, partial [Tanacetum coccineum]
EAAEEKPTEKDEGGASDKDRNDEQATRSEFERLLQQEKLTKKPNSTNSINTVSTPVSAIGPSFTNDDPSSPVNAAEASNAFEEHLFERFSPFKNAFTLLPILNVTPIYDTEIFGNAYDDEDVGADADLNNLETTMNVSPIPTIRIDKDHPKDHIIRDFNSAIQIRRMTRISDEHAMKVWTLVNLPNGKRAIGTKWVSRNKKDERGIVVRNKARLVAQGYTQEEGINYDEVFAPVAMIEAIKLFFAYASFMGFIVYQMDVKSAFLYGTIEEEVYVCQPPGFEDPQFPDKVYKVLGCVGLVVAPPRGVGLAAGTAGDNWEEGVGLGIAGKGRQVRLSKVKITGRLVGCPTMERVRLVGRIRTGHVHCELYDGLILLLRHCELYNGLILLLRHCELYNGLILLLGHWELRNDLTSLSDIDASYADNELKMSDLMVTDMTTIMEPKFENRQNLLKRVRNTIVVLPLRQNLKASMELTLIILELLLLPLLILAIMNCSWN